MSYKNGKESGDQTPKRKRCPKENSDGTNHPSWYTKTASIERLVGANFFRKKAPQFVEFATSGANWLQMPNETISLVLTIPQDKTNAFHTDITQLYKNIRRSNSGAANYTVADLERYILNVRSIRACLASLVRIRRSFNAIDPLNQAVPFDLLNCVVGSNGLNASPWLESLASVDAQLSKMGALIETALPCGDLNIFDRTDWLFGNVFADSKGPKYSYIACITPSYPLYEVNGEGVVTLSSKSLVKPGPSKTLQAACTELWQAFAEFNGEYKNALIAGDIMHAFGEKSFKRTLHWQDVNVPLTIIYDESVLTQIMNATIGVRRAAGLKTSTITNGIVSQTLSYDTSINTLKAIPFDYSGCYINGMAYAMSGGELLTVTRLCWHATNTENEIQMLSCGSEVVTDVSYSYCSDDGITAVFQQQSTLLAATLSAVQSTAVTALKKVASYWSKVDWSPMVLLYVDDQILPMWDVNNVAFIDWNTIDDYHSAATTSLFWATMMQ